MRNVAAEVRAEETVSAYRDPAMTKEEELDQTLDINTLSEHTQIKPWREAYSKFGAKPKKHKKPTLRNIPLSLKNILLSN